MERLDRVCNQVFRIGETVLLVSLVVAQPFQTVEVVPALFDLINGSKLRFPGNRKRRPACSDACVPPRSGEASAEAAGEGVPDPYFVVPTDAGVAMSIWAERLVATPQGRLWKL